MSIRNLALIAVMAVLICVCSWLTIPYVVPFTMQTFAVLCALLMLGGKRGLAAIGLYLLLGSVGLPVFSGFRGGLGHVLGPTGGYIVGFLLTGLSYLLLEQTLPKQKYLLRILLLELCQIPCYLLGTLWFVAVSRTNGSAVGFFTALSLCVLPYLLPDLVKLLLAERISDRVHRALPRL